MTTTRIRPCGEAALLLDCADLAHAVSIARRLDGLRPDAVDVVPAARTVLVTARDAQALAGLRRRVEELLESADPSPQNPLSSVGIRYPDRSSGSGGGVADLGGGAESGGGAGAGREITLAVRYDGPDLADVAELAGISTEELVRRHTHVTWRAAFGGFAPGFCYLVNSADLEGPAGGVLPTVPRLGSPRARVPAGSVALADRFCAVYPGASPGGWRLLGTTDALLWDVDRAEPALIAPGDTVRFRDVRDDGHSIAPDAGDSR